MARSFKGKKAPNFAKPKSPGGPVRRNNKTAGPKHPARKKG